MTTKKEAERAEALQSLKRLVKPGDTVWTILRHCSASGMSRVIDLVVIQKWEGKPTLRSIGYLMAKAGGYTWDSDRQGVKIGGCGMDMGFHLVYGLGHIVWPKGTPKPHGFRNGEPDSDGGYALKHRWL